MGNTRRFSPKVAALAAAIGAAAALSATAAVYESFPGETAAITGFQALRSGSLDRVAIVASFTSHYIVSIVSVFAVVLLFFLAKRRTDALITFMVLIVELLGLAVKELVGRERPMYSILENTPTNPAFPSGHALHAMLFFGLLFVLAPTFAGSPRTTLIIRVSLSLLILACGASRVYLGVHWPSDVFGGFLLGGLGLAALLLVRNRLLAGKVTSEKPLPPEEGRGFA